MIPKLLVHPDIAIRIPQAEQLLQESGFSRTHPDVMWLEGEKLGVEQAKNIRTHLSLKPFQADRRAVVIIDAENLTSDAQNALLKTLEEPNGEAVIILGVASEENLLPTIRSRSQTVYLAQDTKPVDNKHQKKIEELLSVDYEKRFIFIEKLDDKEEFLHNLILFFQQRLREKTPTSQEVAFLKDLLQAQEWASQNVTVRAILEYLMLRMP